MENVEEAYRALVESSNEFLDVMSLPRDDDVQFRNAVVKGSDALLKAERFTSLLSGHARFRQPRISETSAPLSILSDCPFSETGPNQTSLTPQTAKGPHPPRPIEFQQNPNAPEPGSGSKKPLCLDLSLNVSFQHDLNAQQGSSSKSSVYPGSGSGSNPKPPLHRTRQVHQQKLQQRSISTASLLSSILSVDGSVTNMNVSSVPFRVDSRSLGSQSHCRKGKSSGRASSSSTSDFRGSVVVPAISDKVADIPPDRYSWRKYGQKPIKNADHPRAYYKCSVTQDCPARKQVDRCTDDPSKLRVTYMYDHNHPPPRPAHAFSV